jgi:hypothetical protein
MKLSTTVLLGLFCTSLLATQTMAADEQPAADAGKKATAESSSKKAPAKSNTPHSATKERRAECAKLAHGETTGTARKKFINDCMKGTTPAPADKEAKQPAADVKPAKAAQ